MEKTVTLLLLVALATTPAFFIKAMNAYFVRKRDSLLLAYLRPCRLSFVRRWVGVDSRSICIIVSQCDNLHVFSQRSEPQHLAVPVLEGSINVRKVTSLRKVCICSIQKQKVLGMGWKRDMDQSETAAGIGSFSVVSKPIFVLLRNKSTLLSWFMLHFAGSRSKLAEG